MKTKITTEKVLNVYRIISGAKYTKMDDADKIKVWKIARALKPVADKFEDDSKDAAEKMKPTDDFADNLQKAQEFERITKEKDFDASKLPMGVAEYNEFIKKFQSYNKLVGEAVKEFAEKEVVIEFEPLSEESFGKLMASNEWTMEQTVEIGMLIVG